jgi:hypothetical protein
MVDRDVLALGDFRDGFVDAVNTAPLPIITERPDSRVLIALDDLP